MSRDTNVCTFCRFPTAGLPHACYQTGTPPTISYPYNVEPTNNIIVESSIRKMIDGIQSYEQTNPNSHHYLVHIDNVVVNQVSVQGIVISVTPCDPKFHSHTHEIFIRDESEPKDTDENCRVVLGGLTRETCQLCPVLQQFKEEQKLSVRIISSPRVMWEKGKFAIDFRFTSVEFISLEECVNDDVTDEKFAAFFI